MARKSAMTAATTGGAVHVDAALNIIPVASPSIAIATVSIVASPLNPRRFFDPARITEMANDIRLLGVQQPLVVRPYDPVAAGDDPAWHDLARYELVDGERRWRAACELDLAEVPCIVMSVSDAELVQRALSANMQRADLDPFSEGWGYKKALETDANLTQELLGQRFGKSQGYISRMVRLAEMPEAVTALLACGKLDRSHGFALLPLMEHPEDLAAVAQHAVEGGWSSDTLIEKVKLARKAIEAASQLTLPGTQEIPMPPLGGGTGGTRENAVQHTEKIPEKSGNGDGVKPGYTQEDATREFEEAGGGAKQRTGTEALDKAREEAAARVDEAPRDHADETWAIWAEHKYGDVFTGLRRLKEMEDALAAGELLTIEDAKLYQDATTVPYSGLALTALTLDILAAARVEGTSDADRLEDILAGWARQSGIDVKALIEARKSPLPAGTFPVFDESPLVVEAAPEEAPQASGMAALRCSAKLYDEIFDNAARMRMDGTQAMIFRQGGKIYVAFPQWHPNSTRTPIRAKLVQDSSAIDIHSITPQRFDKNDEAGPHIGMQVQDYLDNLWTIVDDTWFEVHDVTAADTAPETPKSHAQKMLDQSMADHQERMAAEQAAAKELREEKQRIHVGTMAKRDHRNSLLRRIDNGDVFSPLEIHEIASDPYLNKRGLDREAATNPESSDEKSVATVDAPALPEWLPAKLEVLIAQQKENPNSTGSRLQTAEEMTADLLLSYIGPLERQFALRLIEADLGSRVCRLYTGQANMGYLIDLEAGRIQGGRIVTSKDIDWELVLAHTDEWITFLRTKSEKIQRSAKAPGMGWIEVKARLAEKKDSPPTAEAPKEGWAKRFERRRQLCVRIRAKENLSQEDLAPWVDDPYVMDRWHALENSRKHLEPVWDQCLVFDISVEFAGRHESVEVWCFPGTGPTNHLELYCDKETGPSDTGYRSCHCDPQQHPEYPSPIEFAHAIALQGLAERFGKDKRGVVTS